MPGRALRSSRPAGRIGDFMDEWYPEDKDIDFSWVSEALEEALEEMQVGNHYPVCDE